MAVLVWEPMVTGGPDGDRGINRIFSRCSELHSRLLHLTPSSLALRMSCVSWQRRLEEEEVLQQILERWEQSALRNHVDLTVEFLVVFTLQVCMESRSYGIIG